MISSREEATFSENINCWHFGLGYFLVLSVWVLLHGVVLACLFCCFVLLFPR